MPCASSVVSPLLRALLIAGAGTSAPIDDYAADGMTQRSKGATDTSPSFADVRVSLAFVTAQVLSLIGATTKTSYRRHRKPNAIASNDAVSVALKFRHVSARGSSGSSSAPSSRPAS